MTNNTFKKFNNSISKDFQKTKWYCKTNYALVFLYFIDLGLGVVNYFFLKDKKIISFEHEFEIKVKEVEITEENDLDNIDISTEMDIETLKEKKEQLDNKAKILEDDINEFEFENLAKNLETTKKEFKELNDKYEEKKNENLNYINNTKKESDTINNIKGQIAKLKVGNVDYDNIKEQLEYEKKIQQKEDEIKKIDQVIKDFQTQNEEKEKRIKDLNQSLNETQTKYQSTKRH